jgi:RNA polymerase sigma-70 factor, ECF subfamily
METEKLVERAQNGDWEAFLELALPYKDSLYRKAFFLLGSNHDAADAVAETMLKAYTSIGGLKDPHRFAFWLNRILLNAGIDMRRRAQKTIPLRPGRGEAAADHAGRTGERLDLQALLGTLDAEQRAVLVLRYYDDLTVEEIARTLDIPAGTVKSRIYYAMKKLRKAFEGVDYFEL